MASNKPDECVSCAVLRAEIESLKFYKEESRSAHYEIAAKAVEQIGRDPSGLTYIGLIQELSACGVEERVASNILKTENANLREVLHNYCAVKV